MLDSMYITNTVAALKDTWNLIRSEDIPLILENDSLTVDSVIVSLSTVNATDTITFFTEIFNGVTRSKLDSTKVTGSTGSQIRKITNSVIKPTGPVRISASSFCKIASTDIKSFYILFYIHYR